MVKQEWSSVRWLLISLVGLVSFAAVIGVFAGLSYKETKHIVRGNEQITMDHIFNGTFSAERASLNWVPEGVGPSYSCYTREVLRYREWSSR